MAIHNSCGATFYVYTLLLTIFLVRSTNAFPIDDVCNQTKNPPLCVLALGGRQSQSSSLPGLAAAGLLSAERDATKSKITFSKLMESSPRPDFKPRYAQCQSIYQEIYETIISAEQALRLGRWDQVIPNVSPVPADVENCEDLFIGTSPAHTLGTSVSVAAEAVLVIGKTLGH